MCKMHNLPQEQHRQHPLISPLQNNNKMKTLNETYGLPKRVKLESLDSKTIGIIKLIKSRIIQKDAKKIIEIAQQIKDVDTSKNVALICTENICSKSKKLLADNNINIIFREM